MFVVACGTAYHSGCWPSTRSRHWTRLPVEMELARVSVAGSGVGRSTLVVAIGKPPTRWKRSDTPRSRKPGAGDLQQRLADPRECDGALPRRPESVWRPQSCFWRDCCQLSARPCLGAGPRHQNTPTRSSVRYHELEADAGPGGPGDRGDRTDGRAGPQFMIVDRAVPGIRHVTAIGGAGGALKLRVGLHARRGFAASEAQARRSLIEDGLPVIVVMPALARGRHTPAAAQHP